MSIRTDVRGDARDLDLIAVHDAVLQADDVLDACGTHAVILLDDRDDVGSAVLVQIGEGISVQVYDEIVVACVIEGVIGYLEVGRGDKDLDERLGGGKRLARDIGDTIAEIHAGQILAACECGDADARHGLRDHDGDQLLLMRKRPVTHRRNAEPVDIHRDDHVDVMIADMRLKARDLRSARRHAFRGIGKAGRGRDGHEAHVVLGAEDLESADCGRALIRDTRHDESIGSALECALVHGRDRAVDLNVDQVGGAVEGIIGNTRHRGGQDDALQILRAAERTGADHDDAVIHGVVLHADTRGIGDQRGLTLIVEDTVLGGELLIFLRNGDRSQAIRAAERTRTDRGQSGIQIQAVHSRSVQGVALDAGGGLGEADGATRDGVDDREQGLAVCSIDQTVLDPDISVITRDRDGGKIRASVKGAGTHVVYVIGDRDARERSHTCERTALDLLHDFAAQEIRDHDDGVTVLALMTFYAVHADGGGAGTIEDRRGQEAGIRRARIKGDARTRSILRYLSVLGLGVEDHRALGEDEDVIAERDIVGIEDDLVEGGAGCESIVADAPHTIRDRDISERGTSLEGAITDTHDTGRDHERGKFLFALEGIRMNGGDFDAADIHREDDVVVIAAATPFVTRRHESRDLDLIAREIVILEARSVVPGDVDHVALIREALEIDALGSEELQAHHVTRESVGGDIALLDLGVHIGTEVDLLEILHILEGSCADVIGRVGDGQVTNRGDALKGAILDHRDCLFALEDLAREGIEHRMQERSGLAVERAALQVEVAVIHELEALQFIEIEECARADLADRRRELDALQGGGSLKGADADALDALQQLHREELGSIERPVCDPDDGSVVDIARDGQGRVISLGDELFTNVVQSGEYAGIFVRIKSVHDVSVLGQGKIEALLRGVGNVIYLSLHLRDVIQIRGLRRIDRDGLTAHQLAENILDGLDGDVEGGGERRIGGRGNDDRIGAGQVLIVLQRIDRIFVILQEVRSVPFVERVNIETSRDEVFAPLEAVLTDKDLLYFDRPRVVNDTRVICSLGSRLKLTRDLIVELRLGRLEALCGNLFDLGVGIVIERGRRLDGGHLCIGDDILVIHQIFSGDFATREALRIGSDLDEILKEDLAE